MKKKVIFIFKILLIACWIIFIFSPIPAEIQSGIVLTLFVAAGIYLLVNPNFAYQENLKSLQFQNRLFKGALLSKYNLNDFQKNKSFHLIIIRIIGTLFAVIGLQGVFQLLYYLNVGTK